MTEHPKPKDTALSLHKPGGFGFAVGHPRVGGRKKGSNNKTQGAAFSAIETARRLKFDPIEVMIQVVQHGHILEPDGTPTPVQVEERMKMLREVAPFICSKAPTEIKGEIDHRHQHVDMTRIMMDPVLAAAAENLALALAEQEQLEAGQVQDAEFEDIQPED